MGDDKETRSRMAEGIDIIIDEAKMATTRAYKKSGAETIGESVKEALRGALSSRDNVVMVRLNAESVAKLDELVESGIVNSRSEGGRSFLISEGHTPLGIARRTCRSWRSSAISHEKTETIRKGGGGQEGAPQPHRRRAR